MKTTAAEFKRNPQKHYRAADNGEVVTINHDRYRDVIFELVARKRGYHQNMDGNFIQLPPEYKGDFKSLRQKYQSKEGE